ncbi:MAG: GntR family transcriptional regulator [Proteobacteria bacterium]|nr:MAG: GntR family transcriptional regulator [Pseudomonadota bacterium]
MAEIGRVNTLTVIKRAPQGVYLQAGWLGEILLPTRQVPEGCQVGDELEVFVYLDSEDRYIATTQKPKAQVGEVAFLKVADINRFGAFLDWGLPKELLVPFNQQQVTMKEGQSYVVYLYSDEESRRIVGSSKLHKFVRHAPKLFRQGQPVEFIITDKTDIGYSAVIENQSWGVLFFCDAANPPRVGQKMKGYIKRIRDDGKIDLSLQQPGYGRIEKISARVLAELDRSGGYIPLSDKSPPGLIAARFSVSKSAYKMAIGSLYRQRLITIEKEGIRITEKGRDA